MFRTWKKHPDHPREELRPQAFWGRLEAVVAVQREAPAPGLLETLGEILNVVIATAKVGSVRGASVGAMVGIVLAVAGAVLRGSFPYAAVVAVVGVVVLACAGIVYGAIAGAACGAVAGVVRGWRHQRRKERVG